MIKEEILALQEQVKALANGINPFTGEVVNSLDLNDPQIIRMFFNMYSALNIVSTHNSHTTRKNEFVFTKELEDKIEITDEYISLSRFLRKIKEINNGIVPPHRTMSMILVDEGYLEVNPNAKNPSKKSPTEKAKEYDIIEKEFETSFGKQYHSICYNRKGQMLIVELLKKYYSKEN